MKTDTALRHDIERELEWDPSFDAGRVGQAVESGIVTLTGEVDSYAQKWNAERAIERVAGVRGVANEIKIRSRDEHNDTDIAKAASSALRWNANLPSDHVIVKVESGWATLSGELGYEYERQAAERDVRYLRGVKGITNLITVRPHVEAKDLKKKIEDSFKRQATLDAQRVRVEVDNGDVTLRGLVRSLAERRAAEGTAWSGPGVKSVTNELTIAAA
jgi:osmotically-inducible protein OsmY